MENVYEKVAGNASSAIVRQIVFGRTLPPDIVDLCWHRRR